MIAQFILDSVVSAGVGIGAFKLAKHWFRHKVAKPDAMGIYPWLYQSETSTYYGGFLCPKCNDTKHNQSQGLICDDEEHYHKEHYHFECASCHFKCVMKTIDDVD